MVRYLLVIHIPGLGNVFIAAFTYDLCSKIGRQGIAPQASDILMYLLRHRCGQHSGIRSGISHHLLLVEFLCNPQRLIGTDLKVF